MADRLPLLFVAGVFGIALCEVAGCGASNASKGSTGMGEGVDGGGGGPNPGGGQMITGMDTVPPSAGLPALPPMSHVTAVVRGNSADISFDPVPGAVDYRVYAVPNASDVRLTSDGKLDGVNSALYRCAGPRAAPPIWVDFRTGPALPANPMGVPGSVSVNTQVIGNLGDGYTHAIQGFVRAEADDTLGYGFGDPGTDIAPIYAVGDPDPRADNYGQGIREPQTRAKLYVTDKSKYVSMGWRDDGVVFYAPASATSKACGADAPIPVYERDYNTTSAYGHVYYVAGAEASMRGTANVAFYLCPKQVASSQPVMRVPYVLSAGGGVFGNFGNVDNVGHDELALGLERFNRARCQGATFGPSCTAAPVANWQIHWSNITAPTQVIVEALDAGCPFQGLLGAKSLAPTLVGGGDDNGNTSLMNDPFFTLDEIKAKAPHGEVFINGQFDGSPTPHPIARSAITLTPAPREPMDFASDFVNKPETFTELLKADGSLDCGFTPAIASLALTTNSTCLTTHRLQSPTYDVLMEDIISNRLEMGVVQGQLFEGYSGGHFRITPKGMTATMSDSTFLHAAMEVTSFTTPRRYPQIIIAQQDFITSLFVLGRTDGSQNPTNPNIQPVMVFNPIDAGVGRHIAEIELCNQRPWAVNNHCPWFLLEEQTHPATNTIGSKIGNWTPRPDLFDRFQDDRPVRFDLYTSTKKAYVFVDSMPYGCVDLAHRANTDPSGMAITPTPAPPPAGPVTVIFGDVQYHAGAESGLFDIYSPFHLNHMLYESTRHFDYIAFKSGEAAPAWDESTFPCATQMHNGGVGGTQTPEQ